MDRFSTPPTEIASSYDCVVIGGGPAGSTVASLVAQAGRSTLLAEREKMPRFHVGESLMPDTYFTLRRLGVLDKIRGKDFVKKYSVQFVNRTGRESAPFYFEEHDPRECSQTWQVERADFDQMLFEHASAQGAHCVDQTRVLDVLFDGDHFEHAHARGVRLRDASGNEREISARVVVDATGQQSLIAHRCQLKVDDPRFHKSAIWTYFENAYRDAGKNGGATLIMHTIDQSAWFWYIPLSKNITSVGVVSDNDYLLKGRGKPEEVFKQEVENCPALQCRLHGSSQVGDTRVAKEFSYSTRQHAGNGWVLVGDAYGFIDPIYSSGVFLALKSGELAAEAIVDGFARNDLSAAQLGRWCAEYNEGVQWIRKLVEAYYDNEFSIGQFMKQHPQHRANVTDLLIGRVFYPGAGRVFEDMDAWIKRSRRGEITPGNAADNEDEPAFVPA